MDHIAETIIPSAAGELYVRASVHPRDTMNTGTRTLVVRATDMAAIANLPPPGADIGDSTASDPKRFGEVFEARFVQDEMCEVDAAGVLDLVRTNNVRIVSSSPRAIKLHLGSAAGTRTLMPAMQSHGHGDSVAPISAQARLHEQLRAFLLQQRRSNKALVTSLNIKADKTAVTSGIAELRALVASLRADLCRTQKMLDEARTGTFKTVVETNIPLDQTTADPQTLTLTGIPDDASAVLVSFWSRSGNEPPSKEYSVSVWSTAGGSRHIHRVYRYGQSAISFDNEVVWFPLAPGQTTLKAQLDNVPPAHNRHNTVLRIRGFRTGRAFRE